MKMYQNNGGGNLRQANKTRFLGISGVFLNFFLRVQHNFKGKKREKSTPVLQAKRTLVY